MRIQLLGPVELHTATGSTADVAGAKRRGVLALLALELGRRVPVERFFELLWDGEPPARAKAALQVHVAALRKVLQGTSLVLLTRSPGYLLTGDAEAVDARRFQDLTTRAADMTDDAEAARLLRQALGLWQGPALADLPDTPLRRALTSRLDDARCRAVEDWAERELRLGTGANAVPALEQVIRACSLREPTLALLIRCLQQAGRRRDALEVYRNTRARLEEHLGISPGPLLQAALEDTDLVHAVLVPTASPTTGFTPRPTRTTTTASLFPQSAVSAAPRLLPRQSAGFVGRTEEFRWLDRECGEGQTGGGLSLLVGPAGSGKTATVVRWAHAAASRFPDGQLFTTLRAFDPRGPVDPAEALGDFLRALGVPEDQIPDDPGRRSALYRQRTQDARLLVVIDNAAAARDVLPLLPSSPHSTTIVTSRSSLLDLVVHQGAPVLRMEALPATDAWALLEHLLTPQRVHAEERAARRLMTLCDFLPLALRIAASRLACRPGWTIADLVTELEDERTRLPALETEGTVGIRSALGLTHRHLSTDAARLLALLAVHPGAEVDTLSAAALLEARPSTTRKALGCLAAYHLLSENALGRFTRHDLIRLYGVELLNELGPEVHQQATTRLLDYYCKATTLAATRACTDQTTDTTQQSLPALPRLPDASAALAWFRCEENTIRALIDATAEGSEQERSSRLALMCNSLSSMAGRSIDRSSAVVQQAGCQAHHARGACDGLHEADQRSDSARSPHRQPRADEGTSPATGASRTGLVSAY